jgi:hypothetical protein
LSLELALSPTMQLEPAVLRTMMSTERFTVDLPMTPVSIHCVPDDWMYSTKKSKLVVVVALAIIAAIENHKKSVAAAKAKAEKEAAALAKGAN